MHLLSIDGCCNGRPFVFSHNYCSSFTSYVCAPITSREKKTKKKNKSESGQIKTSTHRNWDRTSQPKHGENPSNATGWGKKRWWLFPGRPTGAGVAIAAAGTNEYEASETSDSDFYHDQPMEWNTTHVVSGWKWAAWSFIWKLKREKK